MNKLKFFIYILCSTLIILSTNAEAVGTTSIKGPNGPIPVVRLSGADRHGTAAAISREGWRTSEYIIIASGGGDNRFADALAGSPLAYALGCPILLSSTKELTKPTKDEIMRLGAKKAIILGGYDAVSDSVLDELSTMGLSIERLWGYDRYDTAVKIAEKLRTIKSFTNVFLTTGEEYQYAMMISPYASKNGIPILFTEKNSLNSISEEALIRWGIKKADIAGSTDVISQSAEDKLHSMGIETSRVSGKDMTDTNINIISTYKMDSQYIAAARDNLFADSIAGAPFAALKNMNILLTPQDTPGSSILNFFAESKFKSAYIFGGSGGVSDKIVSAVRAGGASGPLYGNTAGNILNGGLSAISNEWIYYSDASNGGRLYKKKLLSLEAKMGNSDRPDSVPTGDASKPGISSPAEKVVSGSSTGIELSSDVPAYINVMGDWIYYSNLSDDMKIYKIKSDGTCRIKLNDSQSSNLIICDNWIYYTNLSKGSVICRMTCDGTLNTQLNDKKSKSLNMYKDWIYYLNADDGYRIYKLRADNPSPVQKLTNINAGSMVVANDRIYFSNINDSNFLYSIGTDGTSLAKLCSDSAGFMLLQEELIYYSNTGDGSKLYSIKTDGSDRKKIYDGSSYLINAAEDTLCFVNSLDSPWLITIKSDGTPVEQHEYSCIKDHILSMAASNTEKSGKPDGSGKNEWVIALPEDDGIPIKDAFNDDGKKIVFLSFDDGPSKNVTPAILDILKNNNIKATFFIVGKMAKGNSDIVKRIYSEGHAIGNHSYSHEYDYLYKNTKNFMGEVNECDGILKNILGEKFSTDLFRFPGGSFGNNYSDYKTALKERGYDYINWNVSTGDSTGNHVPVSALFDNFIESSKGKNHLVILMHDLNTKTTTVEALPLIIKYLKDQGYEFKKLK